MKSSSTERHLAARTLLRQAHDAVVVAWATPTASLAPLISVTEILDAFIGESRAGLYALLASGSSAEHAPTRAVRSSVVALGMSRQLGWRTAGRHRLGFAGLVEGLSSALLPHTLTPSAHAARATSPLLIIDLLHAQGPVSPHLQAIILGAGERMDGTGHPFGRRGAEIECGAQLLGLARRFVTLTGDTPSRRAYSAPDALELVGETESSAFAPRSLIALVAALATPAGPW